MTRIRHRNVSLSGLLVPLGLALLMGVNFAAVAQDDADQEGPDYSRRGADTCLGCHDAQSTLSIFKTPHAQRGDERTPFATGQLQCEACHGPGGTHAKRVRRGDERPPIPYFSSQSTASVTDENGICLGCHETHVAMDWAGSAHETEDLVCSDCHSVHAVHDPVTRTQTQSQVCYGCHVQQRADANKPFNHPIREKFATCTDCHNPHGTSSDFMLVRNSTNETCYTCHQDKRGPLLWEHAPVTEDCAICHMPHGSVHPAMLTKRPPLLCQQCHSQAGHPSVPYTSSGLADGSASPMLLSGSCLNCHSQVHGSNHPSGAALQR